MIIEIFDRDLLKAIESVVLVRAQDAWVDYYEDISVPTDYEERSYFEEYEMSHYITSIREDKDLVS